MGLGGCWGAGSSACYASPYTYCPLFPRMARKYGFCMQYGSFILYTALVSGLVAGLVLLQELCMNNDDDTFVSSVCLSDSNMRAIVAAFLTVIIALLNRAVTDAVAAYRVAQLAQGINEGVYIAMGSNNPYYRLRALGTQWWAVMALLIVGGHTPASLQTVANLFIKTSSVYVRNQSTALVYSRYSYYNVSAVSEQGSVAAFPPPSGEPDVGALGLSNATLSQLPQKGDLTSAFDVLAQGLVYSYTGSSTRGNNGHVNTTVIRSGYLSGTLFQTVDVSDSVRDTETVALVSTICSMEAIAGPLQGVLTSTSVRFNLSDASAGAGSFVVVVLDADGAVAPDALLAFNTSAFVGECISCAGADLSGFVIGERANCTSTVQFQEQQIIYRLSTGGVTPIGLVNSSTTVQPAVAEIFITAFIDSVLTGPVAVQNVQISQGIVQAILNTDFVQGYFSVGTYNFLHTIVCSAASQTLGRLWTIAQGPNAVLSTVPLYSLKFQTYVSSHNMAVFASAVVAATLMVCILGSVYTSQSPINIKDATENALIENLTEEVIRRKRNNPASNDPAKQRELAFSHTDGLPVLIYCREHKYVDSNGAGVCKVAIGYDSGGVLPDKLIDYA